MPTQVIEVGSRSYLCHTDVMNCNVVEIQCKKKKGGWGIIECDKSMVISDVGTVQCNNAIIKFETKKNRVPLNVTKVESGMMLALPNVSMEPSNVRTKINELSNVTKYCQI